MKYALVCRNDPRETGYRVADVFDTIPFEPAPDHFFIECDDDFIPDSKWYDPSDNTLKDFPPIVVQEQPTTTGTQTI
jgi:hypothetical protein